MPMRFFPRPFLAALVAIAAAAALAGCDATGDEDGYADEGLLVPSTSQVNFEVDRGSAVTRTLMLVYEGVRARPVFEPGDLGPFSVEVQEETGSESDGRTTFSVTFAPPEESGTFVEPVVFRAGNAAATVRLRGQVLGASVLVTDFSSGESGFITFGGGLGLSVEDGQLRIDASNAGGEGNYPGIVTVFDAPVDFGETPVVAVRMRAEAGGDPVRVRAALNQAGDLPDANGTIPPLLAELPADGEYRTYYFDFRGNFEQFDGAPVDPANIGELVLLFNDNIDAFSNTVFIDRIERRSNIPAG